MARPRPSRTPRARARLIVPLGLLVAAGIAVYSNGLAAPLVWDDDPAIVTNQTIRAVLPLSGSLSPPLETPVAGRPIVNLSLALNYAMGGLDETGYRLWNLGVVIASALLLFGIVSRTLARDYGGTADGMALVAALAWLVHPLLSETVDYVTQRTESMMGLFLLLTLYAAIRARRAQGSTAWQVISVAACALGMATKESMAVAPLAVLLYDRVFEFDSLGDAVRSRRFLYAGLAATWVELGVLMWHWPRSTVGLATVGVWTYFVNQIEMIARYLGLAVWPRSLVLDYGLPRALTVRGGAAGAPPAAHVSGHGDRTGAAAGHRFPGRHVLSDAGPNVELRPHCERGRCRAADVSAAGRPHRVRRDARMDRRRPVARQAAREVADASKRRHMRGGRDRGRAWRQDRVPKPGVRHADVSVGKRRCAPAAGPGPVRARDRARHGRPAR